MTHDAEPEFNRGGILKHSDSCRCDDCDDLREAERSQEAVDRINKILSLYQEGRNAD